MRNNIKQLSYPFPAYPVFNITILLFRVAIALQIMIVHGFKKLGIGVPKAENIPNPFNLAHLYNQVFVVSANLLFPFFVLIGFSTRLSALPTLAVTLAGYFIVHRNETPAERDIAFMYSIAFLLIGLLGPGKYSVDYLIYKKLKQ